VRLLLPVFGTGVHAVSTVVAAFMGGLALGAWWFGRRADRRGGAGGLRLYAALEAGVAVCALLLPPLLARMDGAYTWVYRRLDGAPVALGAARVALVAAALLVPTTLMGGTLPALARHVAGGGREIGRRAGWLYGANTLGAVLGCAAVAFVLIERLGVRGANLAAAATSAAVALLAWGLARGQPRAAADETAPAPVPAPAAIATRGGQRAILIGYALSGLATLGCEILWQRVLAVGLGITTTRSLSVALIVFLGGLAAGSAAGARRVERLRDPRAAFAWLQLALAAAVMLSIVGAGLAPRLAEALGGLPGWWGHATRLLAAAAAVMLVPTFLMGVLFPVAARLHAEGHAQVGRRVGGLLAANTAGGIAGALVAGFALIPLVGTQRGLVVLGLVHLAVGCAVLLTSRPVPSRRYRAAALALATPALALAVGLPSTFLARRATRMAGAELLHHDESAAGTVAVYRRPDGERLLRVNGAGEVPTDWASVRVFRLLGTLPLLLHPRPEEVLVVAFGGGITLAAAEQQRPARIDCVELVPAVIAASRQLADLNARVFERGGPALRLIHDDGRNHVLRTARRYDVILSDSTHPATADSWVLYTEEFYRLCRQRLAAGGLFAQWLPLHGLTVEDYRLILRTFRTAFPHATLWYTRGYTILLATEAPLAVDLDALAARLAGAAPALVEVDLSDPAALAGTLALDEAGFAAYVGAGPTNTDDRPRISFGDAARAGAAPALIVADLAPQFVREAPSAFAGSAGLRDAVSRRIVATRLTLGAELALLQGNRTGAAAALRRALELAPGDGTARHLLRSIPGGE